MGPNPVLQKTWKSYSQNITWQETKIMSSTSDFFSPSDLAWLSLLVLEAQGTRLLRSFDRLVSMRRLCRMLWGCLRNRKQRLLNDRSFPPFSHCPPGAAEIMKELPITELYLCFLFILPSSRDFMGIIRAGTINQFAVGNPEWMKEQCGTLGNVDRANSPWLKRTKGPLWFVLPGLAAFPSLTRAFQEASGHSLCGINVSFQGTYRKGS